MKKIAVFVLLLGACVLNAEEMRFVTTLSSPLGTFAQLETADPSALSSVPLVNFCNSRASAGTVTLQGADTYIQTLALKNATVLGGNTPEYRISGALSVNNNSEVTGGRLLANTATLSGASSAKSKVEDTLYAASLKVKGAKTANLTIPGQVQTSGSGNNDELEWSNIYTKDYKSDGTESGGNTYTSYLLKSKGGDVVDCEQLCGSSYDKSNYGGKCKNRNAELGKSDPLREYYWYMTGKTAKTEEDCYSCVPNKNRVFRTLTQEYNVYFYDQYKQIDSHPHWNSETCSALKSCPNGYQQENGNYSGCHKKYTFTPTLKEATAYFVGGVQTAASLGGRETTQDGCPVWSGASRYFPHNSSTKDGLVINGSWCTNKYAGRPSGSRDLCKKCDYHYPTCYNACVHDEDWKGLDALRGQGQAKEVSSKCCGLNVSEGRSLSARQFAGVSSSACLAPKAQPNYTFRVYVCESVK